MLTRISTLSHGNSLMSHQRTVTRKVKEGECRYWVWSWWRGWFDERPCLHLLTALRSWQFKFGAGVSDNIIINKLAGVFLFLN